MPARVDVDKISADLQDGMLVIDMPKAEPAKKVQVAEASAMSSKRLPTTAQTSPSSRKVPALPGNRQPAG